MIDILRAGSSGGLPELFGLTSRSLAREAARVARWAPSTAWRPHAIGDRGRWAKLMQK